MVRCPYCGSHNVVPLPMGDYLCLDCEETFYEGERPHRNQRGVKEKIICFLLKKGPELIVKGSKIIKTAGKEALPVILKNAKIFF